MKYKLITSRFEIAFIFFSKLWIFSKTKKIFFCYHLNKRYLPEERIYFFCTSMACISIFEKLIKICTPLGNKLGQPLPPPKQNKKSWNPSKKKMVSVLLSASVERFSVCFFLVSLKIYGFRFLPHYPIHTIFFFLHLNRLFLYVGRKWQVMETH